LARPIDDGEIAHFLGSPADLQDGGDRRRVKCFKDGSGAMNADFTTRIRNLQEQYRDPILTALTALLLVLLFVVAPLQATGHVVFQAFGFLLALAMIAGALFMSGSTAAFIAMLVAFGMNLTAALHRLSDPSAFDIYLEVGAWLILAVTLGWVVARQVFAAGRVTYHRIIGAILLYFLISLIFVALFALVGQMIPKAFSGIAIDDNTALASNLIYFSFVTLTSTGYGDLVPVHPIARSLCNLESIIGQLYPAILLARLVTQELGDRKPDRKQKRDKTQ
jgi:ion channel